MPDKIKNIVKGELNEKPGEEFYILSQSELGGTSGHLYSYDEDKKSFANIPLGAEIIQSAVFSEAPKLLFALTPSGLVAKRFDESSSSLVDVWSKEIGGLDRIGKLLASFSMSRQRLFLAAIHKDEKEVYRLALFGQRHDLSYEFDQIDDIALSSPIENPLGITVVDLNSDDAKELVVYSALGAGVFELKDEVPALVASISLPQGQEITDVLTMNRSLYFAKLDVGFQNTAKIEVLRFDQSFQPVSKEIQVENSNWSKSFSLAAWDFEGNGKERLFALRESDAVEVPRITVFDKDLNPLMDLPGLDAIPSGIAAAAPDLNGDGLNEFLVATSSDQEKLQVLVNLANNDELTIKKDIDPDVAPSPTLNPSSQISSGDDSALEGPVSEGGGIVFTRTPTRVASPTVTPTLASFCLCCLSNSCSPSVAAQCNQYYPNTCTVPSYTPTKTRTPTPAPSITRTATWTVTPSRTMTPSRTITPTPPAYNCTACSGLVLGGSGWPSFGDVNGDGVADLLDLTICAQVCCPNNPGLCTTPTPTRSPTPSFTQSPNPTPTFNT